MFKKIITFIFLLLLLIFNYQKEEYKDPIFKGMPKTKEKVHLLKNKAFWVGYSESRENPLWVAYILKYPKKSAIHHERPDSFKTDKRTKAKVKSSDYTRSGYDRGHMAPNNAIMVLYGKKAQEQTFLMSNISPQRPVLNRTLWKRLENIALNNLTKLNREIFVYAGPIFSHRPRHLKNTNIDIPKAFYKIFAMQKGNKIYMLGLIIPQNARANERLSKFVVSIDEIEKQTGIDFFNQLNDNIEKRLERHIDTKPWKFNY